MKSHLANFLITLTALVAVLSGCGQSQQGRPTVTQSTTSGPPEPSVIELYDAKARFEEPDIVHFEVKYRFTQGGPNNFYSAEVSFPGTESFGVKLMNGWELKESGVIRDGIIVQSPTPTTFEIRVTEAMLPQDGYTPISNVVTGDIQIEQAAASGG